MSRWIEKPTTRKLGLAPRDHLKTSLWTISDSLRLVCKNPNERILLINETQVNACHWLAKIASVVERRPIFRWLFPEVIPLPGTTRWSASELEFERTEWFPECTIEAIGVGGASTSRHYTRIKEDDLCGRRAQESPAVMQKCVDQHMLAESLLNSPKNTIDTYGTRWHPNDLADWMFKHEPKLDVLHLSILTAKGNPLWPARFPMDEIQHLREKSATVPGWFALQYENRVVFSGLTELDPSWLRYWHLDTAADGTPLFVLDRPIADGGPITYKREQLEVYQLIDAGLTATGSSRTANVVVALTPDEPFNVIVLEADARRTTPKETIDHAWHLYQRWNPLLAGIEVFGAFLAFFYWIPTVYPSMALRKLRGEIAEGAKHRRIRGTLSPLGQQGRLYLRRDMADFQEEWAAFPSKGSPNDLLDALSYGPQIWAPPVGDEQPWDEDDEPPVDSEPYDKTRSAITGY